MNKRKLTIRLEPDDATALTDMSHQFLTAWKTGQDQGEFISFATAEQLFRVFTPVKWGVLQALQNQTSPVGVRLLARQLGRNSANVRRDLIELKEQGVIEQNGEAEWFCPFSEIRTEFSLAHAA